MRMSSSGAVSVRDTMPATPPYSSFSMLDVIGIKLLWRSIYIFCYSVSLVKIEGWFIEMGYMVLF